MHTEPHGIQLSCTLCTWNSWRKQDVFYRSYALRLQALAGEGRTCFIEGLVAPVRLTNEILASGECSTQAAHRRVQ